MMPDEVDDPRGLSCIGGLRDEEDAVLLSIAPSLELVVVSRAQKAKKSDKLLLRVPAA